VIAKLDLGAGADEVLAAWRNDAGQLCTDTEEVDPEGASGGGGPAGPCMADTMAAACAGRCADMLPPCSEQLCVDSSDDSSGDSPRYVLTGTVETAAEQIRVTDSSGATRAYPLVGPLVQGTTERVFMLDLGAGDWRRLELVRGDHVVATQQMPLFRARSEECLTQVAPPSFGGDGSTLPDEAQLHAQFEAWSQAFDACLGAGGVDLGGGGSWAPLAPGTPTLASPGDAPTRARP
jgi:hypothetical protein